MSTSRRTARYPRQSGACGLASLDGAARPAAHGATQPWGLLDRARLEALAELFPGWRIWLDGREWHARRRSDGYLQDYRPGAPAFHVSAGSATDLAAQLCWQHAAEQHAPEGCGAQRGELAAVGR